jgi:hypothetical protein
MDISGIYRQYNTKHGMHLNQAGKQVRNLKISKKSIVDIPW